MNNIFDDGSYGGNLPNEDLMQPPDLAQDYDSTNPLTDPASCSQDSWQQDSLNIDSTNSWNTELNPEGSDYYSSPEYLRVEPTSGLDWQDSNHFTDPASGLELHFGQTVEFPDGSHVENPHQDALGYYYPTTQDWIDGTNKHVEK